MNREALRRVVETTDTKAGRRFDLTFQFLIVIAVVSFSVQTLPDLPEGLRHLLGWVEVITVVIFTAEYLLRLWVAESRIRYAFSFFGVIDLLAVLPFYLASGIDLRGVRAFRLLRLFRLFKLLRYSRAISRFRVALGLVREELILFAALALLVLYASALGIYYFESRAQPDEFGSLFHSLWWAVTTLTTVGYGDVYPVTAGGRVFTFLVLMVGLGIVAVPTGLVASALSEARRLEQERSHSY